MVVNRGTPSGDGTYAVYVERRMQKPGESLDMELVRVVKGELYYYHSSEKMDRKVKAYVGPLVYLYPTVKR
jgi:hypothetical protein